MDRPLTREEDADDLLELHSVLRSAIAKHHNSRLELFYQLQYPEEMLSDTDELSVSNNMDIVSAVEQVAPETVTKHPLFKELIARQQDLLAATQAVLASAANGPPNTDLFRRMIHDMQRMDTTANRFDKGITSSLTDVDELTGLLNRTALDRDFNRELAQTKRSGNTLCLALIDADHFKKVNDDYGHNFGDAVLEELADRFEDSLRPRDRIYRYGGEEFLVLLPDTDLDQAEKVMERLRTRSSQRTIRDGEISITQTVSIGLTAVSIEENIDSAIERADKALYAAKSEGRDRMLTDDQASSLQNS